MQSLHLCTDVRVKLQRPYLAEPQRNTDESKDNSAGHDHLENNLFRKNTDPDCANCPAYAENLGSDKRLNRVICVDHCTC